MNVASAVGNKSVLSYQTIFGWVGILRISSFVNNVISSANFCLLVYYFGNIGRDTPARRGLAKIVVGIPPRLIVLDLIQNDFLEPAIKFTGLIRKRLLASQIYVWPENQHRYTRVDFSFFGNCGRNIDAKITRPVTILIFSIFCLYRERTFAILI